MIETIILITIFIIISIILLKVVKKIIKATLIISIIFVVLVAFFSYQLYSDATDIKERFTTNYNKYVLEDNNTEITSFILSLKNKENIDMNQEYFKTITVDYNYLLSAENIRLMNNTIKREIINQSFIKGPEYFKEKTNLDFSYGPEGFKSKLFSLILFSEPNPTFTILKGLKDKKIKIEPSTLSLNVLKYLPSDKK